jgi:hypothetical protein
MSIEMELRLKFQWLTGCKVEYKVDNKEKEFLRFLR